MEKDYLDSAIDMLRDANPEQFEKLWNAQVIAGEMKSRRLEVGLTQAEVAAKLGVPQSRVAEIERNPTRVSYGRLAEYACIVGATIHFIPSTTLAPTTRKRVKRSDKAS